MEIGEKKKKTNCSIDLHLESKYFKFSFRGTVYFSSAMCVRVYVSLETELGAASKVKIVL